MIPFPQGFAKVEQLEVGPGLAQILVKVRVAARGEIILAGGQVERLLEVLRQVEQAGVADLEGHARQARPNAGATDPARTAARLNGHRRREDYRHG